jgi:hypothetical protein
MEEREGYANVTWFRLISPEHFLGTILRIDPALRLRRDREARGRLGIAKLLEPEFGASISAMRPVTEHLPFVRVISCGMHFWKLTVAIRQAEKTSIT